MREEFIKDYWENQAETFQDSHVASWGDNYMIDLEIDAIGQHISDNDTVLDVGCGNGYSTFRQVKKHGVKKIIGIDFAEKMILHANKTKATLKMDDIAAFEKGDVRALRFRDNSFDVVYTTRVIINLPTWKEQAQGINECLRVARPGGKVIISEGFWEPMVLLNSLRMLKQLPPLVEHDFNRYIKKQKLEEHLNSLGLAFEADDFSSIYYLGSRFLRELVTDASKYPGYSNPINEIFYKIEKEFSGGGFGIQQLYIIRKK